MLPIRIASESYIEIRWRSRSIRQDFGTLVFSLCTVRQFRSAFSTTTRDLTRQRLNLLFWSELFSRSTRRGNPHAPSDREPHHRVPLFGTGGIGRTSDDVTAAGES